MLKRILLESFLSEEFGITKVEEVAIEPTPTSTTEPESEQPVSRRMRNIARSAFAKTKQ